MKELKRHVVGSMTCNSLAMSDDGTFIISGEETSGSFIA